MNKLSPVPSHPDTGKTVRKYFVSSQELLDTSYQLTMNIYRSGFLPNYIVAIWRGGTPVGIAVQELFSYLGHVSDHIAIRTSSYTGIASRERTIRVHGLHYLIENINFSDSLLIVDDVFDTGLSIQQVVADVKKYCRRNTPGQIKVATPFYKPENNQTSAPPDYYVVATSNWLVFPHELVGLGAEEIRQHKGHLSEYIHQAR